MVYIKAGHLGVKSAAQFFYFTCVFGMMYNSVEGVDFERKT